MHKSLQEWLQEGKEMYSMAVAEYRELEGQLAGLQERMTEKRLEANQIAKMLGTPMLPLKGIVESVDDDIVRVREPAMNGSATVHVNGAAEQAVEVTVEVVNPNQSAPYTLSSIARALTGKPARR